MTLLTQEKYSYEYWTIQTKDKTGGWYGLNSDFFDIVYDSDNGFILEEACKKAIIKLRKNNKEKGKQFRIVQRFENLTDYIYDY